MIPEVPGFAGDISSSEDLKKILSATWRTINRGGHSIYASLATRISRSRKPSLTSFLGENPGCGL